MTENDYKNSILESKLTPNAKFICLTLLHYRNRKSGACYPSHITLSRATGLCENTVRKATHELKQKGFVSIEQKRLNGNKFTSNIYGFSITPSMDEVSNEVSVDVSNDTSQNEVKPIKPIYKKEGGYASRAEAHATPPEKLSDWKQKIANTIGEPSVRSWFDGAEMSGKTITVPKSFKAQWIKDNFMIEIEKVFGKMEIKATQ